MRLGEFIVLRVVSLIGQILGAIALLFVMIDFIPYDVTTIFSFAITNDPDRRDAVVASLRAQTGLNLPVYQQFYNYAYALFIERSLGLSWTTEEPVIDIMRNALKYSFLIFGLAFIIYTPLAIVMGIISAYYHKSKIDSILRIAVTITYSIPPYILAIWFIIISIDNSYNYALWTRPIPTDLPSLLRLSILPILTTILIYTGFQYRIVRSQFLTILNQDYIRTARAKGLSERKVIFKHALLNALPLFITSMAITFPIAFSGVAVIEIVYGIPGAGNQLVRSALQFDWGVLIGGTVIYIIINAIVFALADVLIFLISPKQRYSLHGKINW